MLKPAMVFTYLLIPAAVILLSGRSPLAIRFLWAIGSLLLVSCFLLLRCLLPSSATRGCPPALGVLSA